jgi:hypothetical protein
MVDAVVGAVAGGLVNKALGGGGGTAPSQAPVTVPGAEFQPFTYRGTGGFDVTGSQVGDDGYSWSANIPDWLKGLGDIGAGAAGGLFQDYLTAAQQDPYAAADEYYQRGLAQLQPELAKQQIAAQERMFGSGRLGLKLAGEAVGAPTGTGAVNPDAYGLAAGQANMLQDLYTNSLSAGQAMQTQYLNQLSGAAAKMLELGLTPNEIEQQLINFGADLESARSTALKAGTSFVPLKETRESVLNAQLANTIGGAVNRGVSNWMGDGNSYFGGQVGNIGFGPSSGQSWGSYGQNVVGGGLWSGGSNYGDYYDPMNDFYA